MSSIKKKDVHNLFLTQIYLNNSLVKCQVMKIQVSVVNDDCENEDNIIEESDHNTKSEEDISMVILVMI